MTGFIRTRTSHRDMLKNVRSSYPEFYLEKLKGAATATSRGENKQLEGTSTSKEFEFDRLLQEAIEARKWEETERLKQDRQHRLDWAVLHKYVTVKVMLITYRLERLATFLSFVKYMLELSYHTCRQSIRMCLPVCQSGKRVLFSLQTHSRQSKGN